MSKLILNSRLTIISHPYKSFIMFHNIKIGIIFKLRIVFIILTEWSNLTPIFKKVE